MSSFIEKNKALLHRVYQTLAVGMFEGDKEAAAELRTILDLPAKASGLKRLKVWEADAMWDDDEVVIRASEVDNTIADLQEKLQQSELNAQRLSEEKGRWKGRCKYLGSQLDDAVSDTMSLREAVSEFSPELCNTCGSITARLNRDGCAKWCCHCGNRLTGTYVPSALEIEDE